MKRTNLLCRPCLELLEDRLAPATFTVTTAADENNGLGVGGVSLREAITAANASSAADTIHFSIAGAGVQTINLVSALPAVTGKTTIAGNTQTGFLGAPLIELNGAGAGAGANGLVLKGAGCVVRGLVINRCAGNGILVLGAAAVIEGCYVGTNGLGTAASPNAFNGVLITGTAAGARVGGLTAPAHNVLSGNGAAGVALQGPLTGNHKVQGNFVGTDLTGALPLANVGAGVFIADGAKANVVGGTAAGARNVLSGNGRGVEISGAGTTGNKVQGNFIGTDFTGALALANATDGVAISGGAAGNTVGDVLAAGRNVISGNGRFGVLLADAGTTGNKVLGNFIGTTAAGTADLGNTLDGVAITLAANNLVGGTVAGARNVISGNDRFGVVVFGAGTTGNLVQGNFIGTNAAGSAALGNALDGVILSGATNNTIGGTVAGARNVISGNLRFGVGLFDAGTADNFIQGNFIGTDVTGTLDLGNVLDGVSLGSGAVNNTIGGTAAGVRNVISGNNDNGVEIAGAGATGNRVQGNFVGTNAAGTAALGNSAAGVRLSDTAANNTIGGTAAGARNVLSGNDGPGVEISNAGTTGNLVQGNFIGTNVAGTAALGNGLDGVILIGAGGNTIGGTTAAARNVISGNLRMGVHLTNSAAAPNLVQGNFIGTNAAGTAALGNARHGVFVTNAAADNQLGGTAAGAGNTIAHNGGAGVLVGSDSAGGFVTPAGSGNAIQGNRIFGNAGPGIDLGDNDGPTANDADDVDAGPNDLLNKPVLAGAVLISNTLLLMGVLNTLADTSLRVEFFASPAGGAQGQTFLGFVSGGMGANTTVAFTKVLTVPKSVLKGQTITATVTDQDGNTSEFSLPVVIE